MESIKKAWKAAIDAGIEYLDKKSEASKPAELPPPVICKQCKQSFLVPIKLPVYICPWCRTPNFA